MNKTKYCPVHCFNYTGTKCPFCEAERISRMVKRYEPKPIEKDENKQEFYSEITMKDMNAALLRLQEHFNNK